MSSAAATAAMRQQLGRRPEGDYYQTPAQCTEALLAADPPPRRVWEPACGAGAISRVLEAAGHNVVSTDLHARGYGSHGVDFLAGTAFYDEGIVTNPPFNLADEFALHALSLGARYVAMFQRLAWLEGRKRHEKLWGPHPPSRIWVFSSRQTLWRGDDPAAKRTGGALAFAWFVWRREHVGPPVMGWLQTRGAAPSAMSLL